MRHKSRNMMTVLRRDTTIRSPGGGCGARLIDQPINESARVSVWGTCAIVLAIATVLILLRMVSLARPVVTQWLAGSKKNRTEVIAIVGASSTGLSLAKKAADAGFRVVIFEKGCNSHGIWSTSEGSANKSSQLQIDHFVYCDLENVLDCTSRYPGVTEIQCFLDDKARALVKSGRVEIRYRCEVERISEAQGGHVTVEFIHDGKRSTESFSSVHVRTGSLSRPQRLEIPGMEAHFKDRWCSGVADGIEKLPIQNSRVCIVGMGAFAIENAKRAIELGAKSVTFVARSDCYVSPRCLMHCGSVNLLQPKNTFLPLENDARWKQLIELLQCTPKTKEYDLTRCIVEYQDMDHYMFTSSAQSDWFYAALTFDAIKIIHGRLLRVESPDSIMVQTSDDEQIVHHPADVVIVCAGHECDTSLLSNIPLTSTMFGMNGLLTHNLRIDKLPHPTLFGPRCAIPHFPVLSYGIVSDFLDTLTVCSLCDKTFYRRWCKASKLYQNSEQSFIEDIDGIDWMRLMWQTIGLGFPELVCQIIGRLYDRYQVCYALECSGNRWYDAVVADWQKYVESLNQWQRAQLNGFEEKENIDGISFVPYPWPAPAPLVPFRRSRTAYQLLSFLGCVIGIDRLSNWMEDLPAFQAFLKMIL